MTDESGEPRYLRLDEAARIARTSITSLRGWIRDGRLPSYRPGRRRLVRADELRRFIEGDAQILAAR